MKPNLRQVLDWPWRVLIWAWQTGKFAWIFLLGIVAALAIGFLVSPNLGPRLTAAGVLLQLSGLTLAIAHMGHTWNKFGDTSLLNRVLTHIQAAWHNFPRLRRHVRVPISGVGALVAGGAVVAGVATVNRAPPKSLEERVAQLETAFGEHRRKVGEDRAQVEKELGAIKDAIANERRAREEGDKQSDHKLARAMLDTLPSQALATSWIFAGIALTGIPYLAILRGGSPIG
jgi:hypothetical protein